MTFTSFEAGWLADRACLLARLGDPLGALDAIGEADGSLAGREGRLVEAMLAYTRGLLAWRRGDLAEAQRHTGEAVATWRDTGARLDAADALETLGSLACARARFAEGIPLIGAAAAAREAFGYRGAGPAACRQDAADAVGAAEEALGGEVVGQLLADGATMRLDEALDGARRSIGGRKRPGAGWASLTPTEEQVVRLVAEGLRNEAIAQRLYLAPGTVKNHLSHIFSKVGVASRAELAVEAVRRQA
jgi:DNA-binding CsgD family transcriptional regulator